MRVLSRFAVKTVLVVMAVVATSCTTPIYYSGGPEVWVGGDSIAYGSIQPPSWVAEIPQPVTNLALPGGGFTVVPLIGQTLIDTGEANGYPDRLIVTGGANDAALWLGSTTVTAAMDDLHAWFDSRGVDVIWVTPPFTQNGTYNGRLQVIHDHMINNWGALNCGLELGKPIQNQYTNDGVHLSALGDTTYAACVTAGL